MTCPLTPLTSHCLWTVTRLGASCDPNSQILQLFLGTGCRLAPLSMLGTTQRGMHPREEGPEQAGPASFQWHCGSLAQGLEEVAIHESQRSPGAYLFPRRMYSSIFALRFLVFSIFKHVLLVQRSVMGRNRYRKWCIWHKCCLTKPTAWHGLRNSGQGSPHTGAPQLASSSLWVTFHHHPTPCPGFF